MQTATRPAKTPTTKVRVQIDHGTVDVTEAYIRLTPAERAAVRDNRESSDDLVWLSTDVWQRHGGPGYVQVEDFLEAFHAP
jgi:hypothetical protein